MKTQDRYLAITAAATAAVLVRVPALALPAAGSQAPLMLVKTVTGQTISLGDRHSARPVLINFFSTY